MKRPAEFDGDATSPQPEITERVGTVIGPYKLLQQIGEGGMGVVYMAAQEEPIRRRVALKIIKPGMGSSQVVARFEAERQALAMMDHTNIAKVLDAGTTESGLPFFVMELVHGVSITKYCDDAKLTPRERLELFVPVCQAIQHAHQKGVIHRDIKPTNVLVTMYDDKPVPKVIDFGVAKAVEQRLTEKTLFTQYGALIGTFEYMSPEQSEMNAFGVDTRSDVYSLGVLLYELLTGTTPLDRARLRSAALDEMLRVIREEEPQRPSLRLSGSGNLPKIAAARRMEPDRLARMVRGEVDWIVMKCLEKDRTRRYETASALAKDVERFLDDEPVEACPPSAGYRLRKLARRYKTPLSVAAGLLMLLIADVIFSTWQAARATAAQLAALDSEVRALEQKRLADDARSHADQRSAELAQTNEKLRHMNYIADVNLARHAWDENNVVLSAELLRRHVPRPGQSDLRGFEWHYLRRQAHQELFTLRTQARTGGVAAWLPDGKRLISFGLLAPKPVGEAPFRPIADIKLWDVAARSELPLVFKNGATDNVFTIAVSPDGKRLATGTRDRKVHLWNIETGQRITTLEGHKIDIVSSVAFSPDGKRLVTRARRLNSYDAIEEVKIWDLETAKQTVNIDQLPLGANPVFSPDGTRIAGGATALKIWDAASGRELLSKDLGDPVMALAFSPDASRLAVYCRPKSVQILNARDGTLVRNCAGEFADLFTLAFSPDGKQLAAATPGAGVKVWDADSGRLVRTFKGHVGGAFSVAFHPDGALLASSGIDGSVKVWDTIHNRTVIPVSAGLQATDYRKTVGLSPDGTVALTGDGDGWTRLWNVNTGELRCAPMKLESKAATWDFSADARRLVLTDRDRNVTVWDVSNGSLVKKFKHDGPAGVPWTGLSPDGKSYACVDPKRGLKVWDTDKGVLLRTLQDLHDLQWFLISPDNQRVIASDRGGAVRAVDFHSGQVLSRAKLEPGNARLLSLSHDGNSAAVGCGPFPGEVHILDAEQGTELSPPLKGFFALCARFSPDGRRLATGSLDGTIKVWDVSSGDETATLKGHTNWVEDVRFSPDGNRLISISNDMTVRIWDATPVRD